MTDFRWDPLRRAWTLLASDRGQSRDDLQPRPEGPAICPFCPGNESLTPSEIAAVRPDGSTPNRPGWQVRVVPSPRPMTSVSEHWSHGREGLLESATGVGAHEILIDSPDHNASLSELSVAHLVVWFKTIRSRMLDLRGDFRLRYFTLVKNHGFAAGARLPHPHSQILALPVPFPEMQVRLKANRDYFQRYERCLQCDLLAEERHQGDRIVLDDGQFVLLAPYASRSPFELSLMPLHHCHDFTLLRDNQLPALAAMLRQAVKRLQMALERPAWQLVLHTAPPPHPRPGKPDYWHSLALDTHWQFSLFPILGPQDGLATLLQGQVNSVPPEEAARCLRDMQFHSPETP